MGITIKDSSFNIKEELDFDILKERLVTELKEKSDNVTTNYKGEITWNSTSLISMRLALIMQRLGGTKGKISIKRNTTGGWLFEIEIDITLLIPFSIIFSVAGAILSFIITHQSNYATAFGILIIAISAVGGIRNAINTKTWVKKIIKKEIKKLKSENQGE